MDEALQYLLDAVLMFECYCDDEPESEWLTQATEFLRSWGVFPPNTASRPTAPCAPAADAGLPEPARRLMPNG